jgi:hypothetical protein
VQFIEGRIEVMEGWEGENGELLFKGYTDSVLDDE